MSTPATTQTVTLASWVRDDDQHGHSLARVEQDADGWLVHGTEVLGGPVELLTCSFRVRLGPDWRTREVEVTTLAQPGERHLRLRADRQQRWWHDDQRAGDLDGCVDVDVAATPLTNTFPIRRLASLDIGA